MERRPENYTPKSENLFSEQQSSPRKAAGKPNVMVIVIAVLSVAVVALAAAYFMKSREAKKYNTLKDDLTVEKMELTKEFMVLKDSLGILKSNYDDINAQLDTSRMQIDEMVERIAKTDATNRAQIRRYQKELGTLRSVMKHYVHQIDSLNTANTKLMADNKQLKKKNTAVTNENKELKKTVTDLASKVETGAIVRGRDVSILALDKKDKVIKGNPGPNHRDVVKLAIDVMLVQNALAEHGRMSVYVIVTDPDGNVLYDPSNPVSMQFEGNTMAVSACRDNIDYNGDDVPARIYLMNVPKDRYVKGTYKVKVLSEQTVLGEGKIYLR